MKQIVIKILKSSTRGSAKYAVLAGCAGLLVVLVMAFTLWPRQVDFSYHSKSCVNRLVVAPDLFKSTGSSDFRLEAANKWDVAGVTVAATKACIVPITAPKEGNYTVKLALFGFDPIGKQFSISVGKPPLASLKPLEKKIAATLPIKLSLNTPDTVFSYQFAVDNKKRVVCVNGREHITCDLKKLSLEQGAEYTVALERYFDKKRVATLMKKSIQTLPAATVTDSTIKPGEKVFTKPMGVQIKLDKKIVAAKAELVRIGDKGREPIATKLVVMGDKVDISWPEELPRLAGYEVVLSDVIAHDGSSLISPYVVAFKTSGGPQVTGVNIGRSKVTIGATATITFDQALSDKQDIHKAITTTGGASITGMRGNQVTVSTSGVPKCGDFSIIVNNALISSHDITGGSSWKFDSRTVCHTVGTIGTSVRGRAIQAYYFGTGSTTILYTGAIHGSEASSRSLMLRWIDELEANARSIPADKTIVIIPAINPDGVAAGTRTNARNVDLNRNFATSDWKKDVTTTTNAPFPGGGGQEPMSEPETQVIAKFVANLRPQLVISYHSIGGLVISNQYGIANARAATYTALSGYRNTTGQTSTTFEYSISGTADDYYAEKLGVASVLVELGSHTYHQFERNQKAMWAMLK